MIQAVPPISNLQKVLNSTSNRDSIWIILLKKYAAPLKHVPLASLLLLLLAPLSADLEHPTIHDLNLHRFLLAPKEVRLEHVNLGNIPLVDVGEAHCLAQGRAEVRDRAERVAEGPAVLQDNVGGEVEHPSPLPEGSRSQNHENKQLRIES